MEQTEVLHSIAPESMIVTTPTAGDNLTDIIEQISRKIKQLTQKYWYIRAALASSTRLKPVGAFASIPL